jgi:hypothetical protein
MPATFIIEEVIADLVDSKKSLVDPLMKLQYFAQLTDNNELLDFVLAELNGYKGKEFLPDYRTLGAIIKVDIQMGLEVHHDKELPVEMLSEKHRDAFRTYLLTDPVLVLEQMSISKEEAKDFSQFLVLNVPLPMIHIFQDATAKLYKGYYKAEVIGVRILTNRNVIPRALTSIS